MSVKRRMEVDLDEAANAHLLVPQANWVYNTPDKQKLNKIRFEEPTPELQPAVIRTTKKMKCLYDMREEVAGKIDLNALSPGQRVCIDKTYLKRVCEISKENQFLSNVSEDSIDFSFALPTRISPKKQEETIVSTFCLFRKKKNEHRVFFCLDGRGGPNPDDLYETPFENQQKTVETQLAGTQNALVRGVRDDPQERAVASQQIGRFPFGQVFRRNRADVYGKSSF